MANKDDVARPTLVLDLDGTLAETAPDLIATLNVLLRREKLAELPLEQARDYIGTGARALIERGLAAAGATRAPDEIDRYHGEFLDYYSQNIASASHLYPGVEDSLARFAESGWQLAVCTNKVELLSRRLLNALGIADRFQAICGRDTFAMCKPHPSHLLDTIAAAGGDPQRAIMVGDSRTDLDTARAAGVPIVGVPFGYSDVPMAELGPDRLIGHFDELWGAANALLGARS